jgi:hypothetical protein
LLLVLLLISVLALVRYFVLPYGYPTAHASMADFSTKLLESLMISLTVTVGIALFVFWLLPDFDEIAKVNVIGAEEIAKYLERAMDETDIWWYMGSTGSYLRSDALRGLTAAARKGGGGCHVIVLLIDPTNEGLCEEFARYRNSLKHTRPDPWTKKVIQLDVLATILSAFETKDQQPQIQVDIRLRQTFSTLRYDVSSKYVVITKEESDAPAMRCDAPGQYYRAYREEVTFAFNQATAVPNPQRGFSASLDIGQVKKLFEEDLKLRIPGIDDGDLAEIMKRSERRKSRHEH